MLKKKIDVSMKIFIKESSTKYIYKFTNKVVICRHYRFPNAHTIDKFTSSYLLMLFYIYCPICIQASIKGLVAGMFHQVSFPNLRMMELQGFGFFIEFVPY